MPAESPDQSLHVLSWTIALTDGGIAASLFTIAAVLIIGDRLVKQPLSRMGLCANGTASYLRLSFAAYLALCACSRTIDLVGTFVCSTEWLKAPVNILTFATVVFMAVVMLIRFRPIVETMRTTGVKMDKLRALTTTEQAGA